MDRPGAAAGSYLVRTDGPMGGYVNPQLAFGRDTQYDWLTGVSAGVFFLGMAELVLSMRSTRKRRLLPSGSVAPALIDLSAPSGVPSVEQSDRGVRRAAQDHCGTS